MDYRKVISQLWIHGFVLFFLSRSGRLVFSEEEEEEEEGGGPLPNLPPPSSTGSEKIGQFEVPYLHKNMLILCALDYYEYVATPYH